MKGTEVTPNNQAPVVDRPQGLAPPARDAMTNTPPPPRGGRRWLVALAMSVAMVVAIVTVVRHHPSNNASTAGQPAIPSIRTATARTGEMGVYINALGTVTPLATVNIYSQITGRVV